MTNIEKLRIMNRVTQRTLDQTMSQLAIISGNFRAEETKLDYLRSVADEYRQNSLIFARQGFELSRLQRQQHFIERLNDAINEQTARCDQLERDIERIKSQALAHRRKIKTFEALITRQINLQATVMRNAEQKLTDEYASRNQPFLESNLP